MGSEASKMSRRPMNPSNGKELINLIMSYTWRWFYVFQRQGIHCEFEEIRSEVSFAVANSMKCFDPDRGTKFSSYAIQAINYKMADFRNNLIQYQRRFVSLETLTAHNPALSQYKEKKTWTSAN